MLGIGCCSARAAEPNAGLLDPSFGAGGKLVTGFEGSAYDVAIQPDGKIVVVGETRSEMENDPSDFVVARFNPNGSPDLTFGTGGQVRTDFVDIRPSAEWTVSFDHARDVFPVQVMRYAKIQVPHLQPMAGV